MDRPLISVGVSYLTGIVLGELWRYFPISTLGFSVVGGISLYFYFFPSGRRWIFILFSVVILLGLIRVQVSYRPDRSDDLTRWTSGDPVRLQGFIDAPLRHGPESTILMLSVRSVIYEGREFAVKGRVRVVVRYFVPQFNYGDRVSVFVRLRPVRGLRNPGGFDYMKILKREGIGAVASVYRPESIVRIATGGFGPLRRIYEWREQIRQTLDHSLSPDSSSILKAMLIGETGFLTPEVRETFMASGTAHLLSISGSHLAFVALGVFNVCVRLIKRMPADWLLRTSRHITGKQLAVLITILPVTFYTVLAGGQIATVRSLIMIYVFLATVWLQRMADPMNALAIAALLIVLWDPWSIFSVSFQLSFIAVLSMILVGQKRGILAKSELDSVQAHEEVASGVAALWEKIRTYWIITGAAGLSTMPLVAHYFNQIGWVGFLSNIIAVPFVGMVIVPLGLTCSMGSVFFETTHLPLAGLNDALVEGLSRVIEGFASLPYANIHVPAPPVPVLVAIYLGGILVFGRPERCVLKWSAGAPLWMVVVVWIVRVWASHPEDRLRVTFLDVGQGDAAWIEMPDGKTMLIDGGGAFGNFDAGRIAIAPYLWNTGRWKVDYMVVSHPQSDHMAGLCFIASHFKVGEIWTNGVEKDAEFFRRFQEIARMRRIPQKIVAGEFEPVRLGDVRFLPLRAASMDSRVSENDRSVVLRVEYKQESILFTGDIERAGERSLLGLGNLLPATILKVPHHGSRSSIDPDFLSKVHPETAVISVGAYNPYRHPSPETIAAYRARSARIYRTDRDGAVVIETDGYRRVVRIQSDRILQPVRWKIGMVGDEMSNFLKIFRHYWYGPA